MSTTYLKCRSVKALWFNFISEYQVDIPFSVFIFHCQLIMGRVFTSQFVPHSSETTLSNAHFLCPKSL